MYVEKYDFKDGKTPRRAYILSVVEDDGVALYPIMDSHLLNCFPDAKRKRPRKRKRSKVSQRKRKA